MLLTIMMMLVTVAPAVSDDQWTKSFDVDGASKLRIETSDANIRVEPWDKGAIEVRVTTRGWQIGGKGLRITDSQNGNEVTIEVRFPSLTFSIGNRSVDIEVHVPRESALDLHTGDGNVSINGITGNVRLRSGDGNIDVRNVKGDLTADTGDGNVTIDAVDGTLHATTGDGDIDVSGRFDTLEVRTGDGRIDARALPGSKVSSNWNLQSGDGNLTLRIPDGLAAEVELHTGDGHIDLGVPLAIYGRLEQKTIHGKLNGGGAALTLRTGDGSIRLEKL
jgi:DUF4097 and DUF4098 domain-containing protein YvlB